jgi:competence protein ComEA
MRLPCFIVFLIAIAFASCARHEKSAEPDAAAAVTNRAGGGATNGPVADTRPRNPCVNLNTATREELMQLPGIGEVMSGRIIEYRERHGPFRRPEDMIIIEGFSEKKYRALAALVCVE